MNAYVQVLAVIQNLGLCTLCRCCSFVWKLLPEMSDDRRMRPCLIKISIEMRRSGGPDGGHDTRH